MCDVSRCVMHRGVWCTEVCGVPRCMVYRGVWCTEGLPVDLPSLPLSPIILDSPERSQTLRLKLLSLHNLSGTFFWM